MKEDDDDNKESVDPNGHFPLCGGGVERRGRGRLFAQQPDADSRTLAHCPRQSIGVGAPVYPCGRNGNGHCWRCDGFGLPILVSDAIPNGDWAIVADRGVPHGWSSIDPNGDVHFHEGGIDRTIGNIYFDARRHKGGRES